MIDHCGSPYQKSALHAEDETKQSPHPVTISPKAPSKTARRAAQKIKGPFGVEGDHLQCLNLKGDYTVTLSGVDVNLNRGVSL